MIHSTQQKFMGFLAGIIPFIVYMMTLPKGISGGDSAELAVAIHSFGLPHPTGFPLYILIGKLWTIVFPFGEFIWRLNILTAVFASATITVLFFILKKFHFSNLIALVGCFSLAFADRFWFLTTSVNTYSISLFFIALTLLVALHINENKNNSKKQKQLLYILSVCIACGMGTHFIYALCIPFLVLFFFLDDKKILHPKNIFFPLCLTILLIGLLYLYVPLNAHKNPVLSWGIPNTLEKFIAYIRQEDYSYKIFTLSASEVFSRIRLGVWSLTVQSFILGSIVSLFGSVKMYKENKNFLLTSIVLILINFFLICSYGDAQDKFFLFRYITPTQLILTIWFCFGITYISKFFKATPFIFLLLPLTLLITNYPKNDFSKISVIEDFTKNVFSSNIPSGSIILSKGDLITPSLWYYQIVQNQKNNIIVIDANLVSVSWYASDLSKKYSDFLPADLASVHHTKRLQYLVDSVIQKKELFITEDYEFSNVQKLPWGILQKIEPAEKPINIQSAKENNHALWESYVLSLPEKNLKDRDPLIQELVSIYPKILNNTGIFYASYKEYDEMVWIWEKALDMDPTYTRAAKNLSNYYKSLGEN